MRKVFSSDMEVFRIYKSGLSPDAKQPAVIKKVKIAEEPETEDSDFLQMLNAQMRALT